MKTEAQIETEDRERQAALEECALLLRLTPPYSPQEVVRGLRLVLDDLDILAHELALRINAEPGCVH